MHGWVHVHSLLYEGEERWCFNKQAYTLTNNSKIQGWPGKLIIKISGHGFSVTAYSVKWIIRYSPWRFLIHVSIWIRIKLYSEKTITHTHYPRTNEKQVLILFKFPHIRITKASRDGSLCLTDLDKDELNFVKGKG